MALFLLRPSEDFPVCIGGDIDVFYGSQSVISAVLGWGGSPGNLSNLKSYDAQTLAAEKDEPSRLIALYMQQWEVYTQSYAPPRMVKALYQVSGTKQQSCGSGLWHPIQIQVEQFGSSG